MPDATLPTQLTRPPSPTLGDAYLFGGVEDLRQVLNHLHAGVVAHAADTTIRVCNPRACEILGLTMDQVIGVTAPDPKWAFLREDGTPMPLDEYPVNQVIRTGQRQENLVVGINRPARGDVAWALCNGYPVVDGRGRLQLVIISFIDITELRRAEKEREELQEQLRQATKMEAIGRLAGGVAHDFNNLLTGIMGYAELVELALDPEHPARGFAAEILRGSERAADLTAQLLAFARKQVVEPRVMQLNEVVERAENLLRRLIGEDILLSFRPAEDLSNIRADPGQLDQALMNLVVNARDAMPDGGALTIETHNVRVEDMHHAMGDEPVSGDFVVLAVSDEGHGMDAQTRERIFEPFFSTKGPSLGTGLGLATVYGIVSQNDGFITVYSEPGAGSTFKLYFPAVDDAVAEVEPDNPTVDASTTGTVLLVEDEAMVRALARRVLDEHGFTVLDAEDGQEALLLSRKFSGAIDLLLTDVVMPGMNGRELFEQLRQDRPGLRALFMSGYTEHAIARRGALEPGTDFLQKPFTVRGLLARVQEMLR